MPLSYKVVLIVCLLAPAVLADPVTQTAPKLLATDVVVLEQRVHALIQQGQVALENAEYQPALDLLQEAQHLIHRAFGVHTLRQATVVDLMSQVRLSMGDLGGTTRLRQFKLDLYRRHYGHNNPGLAPELLALGDWYQLRAMYADARELYSEAFTLLAANNAPQLSLVRPATALAYTDYLDGRCCRNKELEQIVHQLARDQAADNVEQSMALVTAGDLLLMQGDAGAAQVLYQLADSRLPGVAEVPVLLGVSSSDRMARTYRDLMVHASNRRQTLPSRDAPIPPGSLIGSPLPFCEARVDELSRRQDYHNYVIQFELTVLENGRVKALTILESNATPQVNLLAARLYSQARFRPRLEEGSPISHSIRITQRFDRPASLYSEAQPFPPANLAVFHGCFGVADSR
ncbi:MAG: hypothetical protein ACFHX7_15285 [Pseudomonadota bacterium]